MGRGRQKAKQTKVARALKYYSPETNYSALEQELTGHSHTDVVTDSRFGAESADDLERYDQRYNDWSDDR
ncbi:DUF3073 domain-containing protein [Cellulosimicrobium cellulans]|uniref:DUF3073 family protein n=1 Tax=Cellulosimicrobium protaetiae TaxID=2587808 RepID=A0A6M5UL72_9MICO|nr:MULTISPECIES: DUF3073 domain-containing protein [Cellulosimicrobium]MBN0039301.1 DUF3073 domain-containing protein [Cellulosimicrobium cellulans]QJW37878.1 DUF3073 family protein [Cellulosimicrobium protaetiae]